MDTIATRMGTNSPGPLLDPREARYALRGSTTLNPERVQVGSRDTSGRGLHLVEAMADRWGVEPDGRGLGKTVWFELDVPAS